jgi:polygalacturonase
MSIVHRRKDNGRNSTLKSAPTKLTRAGHGVRGFISRPLVEGLEKRQLLSFPTPTLPTIPSGGGHLFNVTSAPYDAVGDGVTNDTAGIQAAINAASAAGGGTVEIPAAASPYECGAISMANNVNLQVDSGAVLQALSSLGNSASVWISVSTVNNWEISGTGSGASMGMLDGNSGGGIGTLNMIKLSGATVGLIQNIFVNNSPHEHIQCGSNINNNITINGVTIASSTTAANTDGIDPAGLNWLIENCSITDGDDNIALKPQQQFCSNITIQNCTLGDGHGISIGGQTNLGLNGMIVNNITFNGTTNGLRLKADRGNGGLVTNVSYSNITMTNVQFPILIDSYYNGSNSFPANPTSDTGSPVTATTPIWSNISFANITSTDAAGNAVAAAIYGLPEEPINNVSFTNVNLSAPTGMQIDHVRNMTFDTASHITVTSGNDLIGTTSNSFPHPVDAQITGVGWTNTDIGSPTIPRDTSESLFDPNTSDWTIMGGGAGFASTSDQFNYTYQPLTTDGSISATVTALTSGWAGVMDRASTNATDPFVSVVQTASQILFDYRTTAGAAVQQVAVSAPLGTNILQISRSGESFGAYYSTNGTSFTQIGSNVSIAMGSTPEVGLAATSNSNGNVGSASFSNVAIASFLTLTTPASATAVNVGNPFSINWTGGNSSDTVQLWAEGGPNAAWSELTTGVPDSNGSFSWDTTSVAHGWYHFMAWDIPVSGSVYSVDSPDFVHVVNPSAAAPNISISTPALSSDTVSEGSPYTINFAASDGSGDTNPVSVQLWVYSQDANTWSELPSANALPSSQTSYNWDTTGMAPGWYSFSAHATDGDQWSYAASPGWVHITSTVPTIAFTTPTSGQMTTAGGTFNINYSVTNLTASDLSQSTMQIWSQNIVNGSPVYTELTSSASPSAGTFAWTVPTSPGSGTFYSFVIWLHDGDQWYSQASPNYVQVS